MRKSKRLHDRAYLLMIKFVYEEERAKTREEQLRALKRLIDSLNRLYYSHALHMKKIEEENHV